jgi:exopolysaccharide biosynthesis protein
MKKKDKKNSRAIVFIHFQQYFSYIVAVSFIGGGNLRTRIKTTDLLQVTVQNVNILTEYCTINTGKDDSFKDSRILVLISLFFKLFGQI